MIKNDRKILSKTGVAFSHNLTQNFNHVNQMLQKHNKWPLHLILQQHQQQQQQQQQVSLRIQISFDAFFSLISYLATQIPYNKI